MRYGRILAIAGLAAIASCSENTSAPIPAPVHRRNFSQRRSVLDSLETGYNNRRIETVAAVLDSKFTFFTSLSDVAWGLPDRWDRAAEVEYTGKLLDPNYGEYAFNSIQFNLHTDGALTWDAVFDSLSGETRYRTIVDYDFKFAVTREIFYYNSGSPATFTLRNAGTSQAPYWQIVECRDLAGGCFMAGSGGAEASVHPCPEHSWGATKGLYWVPCSPCSSTASPLR